MPASGWRWIAVYEAMSDPVIYALTRFAWHWGSGWESARRLSAKVRRREVDLVSLLGGFGLGRSAAHQNDLAPIPLGEPFETILSLLPTSYQFNTGDRIRITVAFADKGNFDTPILDPPLELKLLRKAAYPSFIELPIIQDP